MPMLRFEELTWTEVQALPPETVLVLPTGSMEQHGPHLPLGTDVYIPVGLADRLADALQDGDPPLVMLTPLSYTYAKESNWWPGTVNLDGTTLISVMRDLLNDLFRQNLRRVMVINGHMESVQFLMEGVQLAVAGQSDARVVLINWWEQVSDRLIDEVFGDAWPGWEAEHAALTETAMMLSLYPDLVRRDQVVADRVGEAWPYKVFPQREEARAPSGVFADASPATAEIGERVVAEIVQGLRQALLRQFGG